MLELLDSQSGGGSTETAPAVGQGRCLQSDPDRLTGSVETWPVGAARAVAVVENNPVVCRVGGVTLAGVDVVSPTDMELTHEVVSPGFTVGYYLRGTVSGAVGRVVRVPTTAKTVVAMVAGSVAFQAEHCHETSTGLSGDDTGKACTVTSFAAPSLFDTVLDPGRSVVRNLDPDTNTKIAFRALFGTAHVRIEPSL